MGKIEKILKKGPVEGQTIEVYPVTSTKAVYDENNKRLDNVLGGLGDRIDVLENAGYLYAGVATIDTDPGTPDAKVFYIANGKGTYANFGGIEVTEDGVIILYYDTAWHKVTTGIASGDFINISNDGVYFVDNQGYIILSITEEGIKTINVPAFESTTDTEYDINI